VSVGFRSWFRFLAVSLQVTWVINPAVGCHYFPPGPQLPSQPLRGLLPIPLLGEHRHDWCEQFAWDCYPTASLLRFEPRPYCAWVQHANHSATERPTPTQIVLETIVDDAIPPFSGLTLSGSSEALHFVAGTLTDSKVKELIGEMVDLTSINCCLCELCSVYTRMMYTVCSHYCSCRQVYLSEWDLFQAARIAKLSACIVLRVHPHLFTIRSGNWRGPLEYC